MTYFKRFNPALYKFGNETAYALTTNLTQYVDMIDQIKTKDLFFEDYVIPANERPDQTSYKLYGTTDYYWTFFLANDHIRENGWPLTYHEVVENAKKRYPHRVVTVKIQQPDVIDYYDEDNKPIFRTKLVGTPPDQFEVGSIVTGNASLTKGIILKRDLSLGTFVIDTENVVTESIISDQTVTPNSNGIIELERTDSTEAETFTRPLLWLLTKDGIPVNNIRIEISPFGRKVSIFDVPFSPTSVYKLTYHINTKNLTDGKFSVGEELSYRNPAGTDTSMIVFSETSQWNSVHHFEDDDGNWVDINPIDQNRYGYTPVTHLEHLTNKNEELRQIKIIKRDNVFDIARSFAELMSQ